MKIGELSPMGKCKNPGPNSSVKFSLKVNSK